MSQGLKVAIAGAGWPGQQHAKAYAETSGFTVTAVADLIPDRRKQLIAANPGVREFADATELAREKDIDVVSVCLPTHLHATVALAALRAGKHVLCERPPALNLKEAKQLEQAAEKNEKVLLYSIQRRFGGPEQASIAAAAKGYIGDPVHARAVWTRTRGVPVGTGWFTDRTKSGGGAMIDLGLPMLDLAWTLLGRPAPQTAYAIHHQRFREVVAAEATHDAEDSSFALIRFEGGQSLELFSAWAINQPPAQEGTACRVYGSTGAIEVYTPQGATIFRGFAGKTGPSATALKPPKVVGYSAVVRHFRDCVQGKGSASPGGAEGVLLMSIVEAIYRSAETGKSAEVK